MRQFWMIPFLCLVFCTLVSIQYVKAEYSPGWLSDFSDLAGFWQRARVVSLVLAPAASALACLLRILELWVEESEAKEARRLQGVSPEQPKS